MNNIIKNLKDWWWLITLVFGVTVFVGTLPKRLNTVEAGVETAKEKAEEADKKAEKVDDDFRDYLKTQQEVAESLNKYVAQQQMQQQMMMQQQIPNQVYRRPEPEVIKEQDSDGVWWCCEEADKDSCYRYQTWYRC